MSRKLIHFPPLLHFTILLFFSEFDSSFSINFIFTMLQALGGPVPPNTDHVRRPKSPAMYPSMLSLWDTFFYPGRTGDLHVQFETLY